MSLTSHSQQGLRDYLKYMLFFDIVHQFILEIEVALFKME